VYTFWNQKAENFTSSSSYFAVFISPSPLLGCLNFHHQGFLYVLEEF
jgi:hypothetical protein